MVFHLRLVVSFKTRKGKQGSKGLSKELIQGKSIWLEAYKNKIALIISKYACELGSINKNQAKAIVQAINGAKHTKRLWWWMAQILTKVNLSLSNWAFKTIMTCRGKTRISNHKMSRTFIFKTITHFLNISYNSKKNMQSRTCTQNWPKILNWKSDETNNINKLTQLTN